MEVAPSRRAPVVYFNLSGDIAPDLAIFIGGALLFAVGGHVQRDVFQRALDFREANIHRVDGYDEFREQLDSEGGFFLAHWDGSAETEERVQQETKATIRCIPLIPLDPADAEPGECMVTGKPSEQRVIFARAY